MNDELLEKTWKEAAMVQFQVISQNWPGGTERNHEEPQSGQSVSQARLESDINRIQVGMLSLGQC
jgi:hypothetical protein